MKASFGKIGLLAILVASLMNNNGEALAESSGMSACEAFGNVKTGVNPSFQHVNCLLTNAALEADIPPEVFKAVATKENGGWKQFDANGNAVTSSDGGIGLMQITNQSNYDQEKLKTDLVYNIEAGIQILDSMYDRTSSDLPKIKDAGRHVIENWYFPVMAYNGIKPVNSPIVKGTGLVNTNAYQERVFAIIEQDSFAGDRELAAFPFHKDDFAYDPSSNQNITFLKKEYVISKDTHDSIYGLKAGDYAVTTDAVNLRIQPGSTILKQLPKQTVLTVTGPFLYGQGTNQYVWYPVRTSDGQAGYIASAYLEKTGAPAISFSDVSMQNRFYTDITALSKRGIISGFPDGSFGPRQIVTRGQAAIMMARAFHLPVSGGDYIEAVKENGMMSGFTDGHFYENDPVTRGQMAILLTNAFDLKETGAITFSDVSSSMKAYDSIKRVVAAEIAFGYGDNTFKPDSDVTREQFSAFLNRALQK
ncbi:S-layer homology domain-containing protein [Domibacillus mangrovi]|uniref:SLH domain-containing protein n=1 Tax=Domibacillus mangrovi TaxID=1714354 RepID=A0A1Q5P501_9BACI|nr:S-layer homology domain-containing protein [Domibacillus mangrovi]OKL37340.1 hypothetical protein BLL40_07140 [Domibacillus mangrovi]